MIPLPFALAYVAHRAQQRRATAYARAPAHVALVRLHAAPAHQLLSIPLHLRGIPGARTVSQGQGVSHPTPAEVAQAAVQRAEQLVQQWLAQQVGWLHAHPKPPSNAQPADIAAWLKGAGMSPRVAYPEWGWHIIQKGPPLSIPTGPVGSALQQLVAQTFEPGEAIAAVQLGDHDAVTWYVHPSGAWSYHHVWGEDFGQVLSDVAQAVGHAVQDAAKIAGEALKAAQTIASFIPGVGQVVNEVVAAAETAIDALSGDNALQLALESAYRAALAAVPGAEALQPLLDPIVDTLKTIAGGKKAITKSVLAGLLSNVPDSPSVGALSPRSVASSLATWLASKVGLA